MAEIEQEAKRDGLHCVYDRCQFMEFGRCSPGCSFTMTVIDPMEMMRRNIEKQSSAAIELSTLRHQLAQSQDEVGRLRESMRYSYDLLCKNTAPGLANARRHLRLALGRDASAQIAALTPHDARTTALAAGQRWVPSDGKADAKLITGAVSISGVFMVAFRINRHRLGKVVRGYVTEADFRAWIARHDARLAP